MTAFSTVVPYRSGLTVVDASKPTPPTGGINVAIFEEVSVLISITSGSGSYEVSLYGSSKNSAVNTYKLLFPGKSGPQTEDLNMSVNVAQVEYLYVGVTAIAGVTLTVEVATPGVSR